LDADQFAAFFAEIGASRVAPEDVGKESLILPETAQANAPELLFSTLFNARDRTHISWLEFWVYQCAMGHRPKDEEWLSTVGVPEEEPASEGEAAAEGEAGAEGEGEAAAEGEGEAAAEGEGEAAAEEKKRFHKN